MKLATTYRLRSGTNELGLLKIWISPIVENLSGDTGDGESYHGYWAQNIESVNSNFGTESDLVALSAALHARGMVSLKSVLAINLRQLMISST